jgi:hypothetical protein
MKYLILAALLIVNFASAQTVPQMPEKLRKAQEIYNTAIARANAPITASYLKELERLKAEFTRAGDLKAAVVADELIKEAGGIAAKGAASTGSVTSLASMSVRQFKKWLSSVVISEVESPNGNTYTMDNDIVLSTQAGSSTGRTHPTATVEVGKIIVPFTSTTATIVVDPSMSKAEVTFNPGSKFHAVITPKKKK